MRLSKRHLRGVRVKCYCVAYLRIVRYSKEVGNGSLCEDGESRRGRPLAVL